MNYRNILGTSLSSIVNKTENRLLNKPSKRNLEKSENLLLKLQEKYRLNTLEGELLKENYIKINNTDLSPEKVARTIKDTFNLLIWRKKLCHS